MTRMRDRWLRFWFAPGSCMQLGAGRVLFVSALAAHYWTQDLTGWSEVSHAFWFPGPFVKHLMLSSTTLHVLQPIWKTSLLLAALGVFTRASLTCACLLTTVLLGMRSGFVDVIFHEDALAVFGLFILAIARSGDALSVDRAIHRRPPCPPSAEYTWPSRLMQCLLCCVFFAAGLSKLRHSGLSWPGEVFPTIQMAGNYGLLYNSPVATWGTAIYGHPALATVLGFAALTLELACPLALVSRRARTIFPAATATFLVAVRLLMGPCFVVVIAAHVFWVPWDRLADRHRSRVST